MAKARGFDVSDFQNPANMRYAEWRGLGFCYLFYQVARGLTLTPFYAEHRRLARLAGYLTGPYLYLRSSVDAAAQARLLVSLRGEGDELPDMVDVENKNLIEAWVRLFCNVHDAITSVPLLIYCGKPSWETIVPPLRRSRYASYKLGVAGYPFDSAPQPDGQDIQPMDPASVARRSTPPLTRLPAIPAPWTEYWYWQHTGHGTVPGYSGFMDMEVSEMTEADLRASVGAIPSSITNMGCLLGGHTQGPSQITPIYTALKARGARLKFIISDEDGGKMIEHQALGTETRVNRKHLPETGPNHWMEGGGDADVPLTAQQKEDFITTAMRLPYRASVTEFRDTTHFQVMGNEYERNTPQQWVDYLDLCQQVILRGEQLSAHDKAVLMGISDAEAATLPPVKYAIPVFNAGSPHTWEMYQAIADHPIWPLVSARGDLLFCHEGIGFDQPFDWGENMPVEPEAPQVPGAGLVNFRIFNLLWLLWRKGIRVKWGVGEWYDGRKPRTTQILERVLNMIRHDTILSQSPFSADCVGYGQFQFDDNPNSPWYPQDCTLLWQTPEWQQHVIDVSNRINGGNAMQYFTDLQVAQMRTGMTTALAVLNSGHVWKENDIALAIINPLATYNAPNGTLHDLRPPTPPGGAMVTYDLNVQEVSADGAWLRVAAALWVRAVDVKPKGS